MIAFKEQIEITVGSGKQLVKGRTIAAGKLAITPSRRYTKTYTITHLPTGYSILKCRNFKRLKTLADRLLEAMPPAFWGPLPRHGEEIDMMVTFEEVSKYYAQKKFTDVAYPIFKNWEAVR